MIRLLLMHYCGGGGLRLSRGSNCRRSLHISLILVVVAELVLRKLLLLLIGDSEVIVLPSSDLLFRGGGCPRVARALMLRR